MASDTILCYPFMMSYSELDVTSSILVASLVHVDVFLIPHVAKNHIGVELFDLHYVLYSNTIFDTMDRHH